MAASFRCLLATRQLSAFPYRRPTKKLPENASGLDGWNDNSFPEHYLHTKATVSLTPTLVLRQHPWISYLGPACHLLRSWGQGHHDVFPPQQGLDNSVNSTTMTDGELSRAKRCHAGHFLRRCCFRCRRVIIPELGKQKGKNGADDSGRAIAFSVHHSMRFEYASREEERRDQRIYLE